LPRPRFKVIAMAARVRGRGDARPPSRVRAPARGSSPQIGAEPRSFEAADSPGRDKPAVKPPYPAHPTLKFSGRWRINRTKVHVMLRSLWISKTGMEAQQLQLDNISHNLANVATNGYKKSHAQFEDLIYQNLRQSGSATSDQTQLPSGLQVGLGVRPVATARDFTQGSLQQTGNTLDVAISGNGFLQVTMPDGTTGYTRDGALKLDAQGQLVNNEGFIVQPGITIPAQAQSISIGADGTVSATLPGTATPSTLGQLQLASFANPGGLDPKGGNLYAETAASGSPSAAAPGTNGLGRLQAGFVETSNVNVVEELVAMISTQRAYELNSKAIQTSDQMLQRLGQL
jgi:flagellar basal-body rod protein FlgG